MNEAQIKSLLEQGLPGCRVTIGGDGRHFEAVIVGEQFAGKSMIERHRMVHGALGDSFQTDAIHALSFKTMTPEEAAGKG